MSIYSFKELKLKAGDIIYMQNENGEGITGIFEDYNSSQETFRFQNYSNGKNEIIQIEKLQSISRG
ncbi:hypothetical protein P700755_002683 [Psychroflexus torquis ATCC 700755]|uniref:DUF4926 domain-containing protein n=1 Tax=Psychroflexus torquis (strain ATCC 700755 / CIP 106069 / ACAM 623) TaxID=313595 RepID=K4IGD3_PSYTT|nr:hypothetical protein [Psychroflexus torquis]AFU69424.1 hypothetical protein P700755_002683 [Psychroflexus torquis ATCC 700755]